MKNYFIILGVIACEALVQLWFAAAPLQPFRKWLIQHTPFLDTEQGNLFECKYCVSVWVGLAVATCYYTIPAAYQFGVIALCFHRLSNFIHLIFSYLRDKQVDLRIARGKCR